jgi:hypothetical protein
MLQRLDTGGTRIAKRIRFTPAVIETRSPKVGRIERRDDLSPLWLRITATGDRSFAVRVRVKGSKQPIRLTFPIPAHISNLEAARTWAVEICRLCREGRDPRAEKRAEESAAAVERQNLENHALEKVTAAFLATNGVTKKNAKPWRQRTYDDYTHYINQRLLPRWKGHAIHSITRDQIVDFVNEIAETAPITANRTLAVLSCVMSWYQTQRGSEFTSPIVRGMAPAEETARERTLTDNEIRLVWHVAGRSGVYGGLIQSILLNATRRGEPAAMCHSQIDNDGIWALPGEFTKNHLPLYLPLSADSLAARERPLNAGVTSVHGSALFPDNTAQGVAPSWAASPKGAAST